jgi:hypothetical protein
MRTMMNKIIVSLCSVVKYAGLAVFMFIVITLSPSKSTSMSLSEIVRRGNIIEEQRIIIEEDRQALNIDCSRVASTDTAKIEDYKLMACDYTKKIIELLLWEKVHETTANFIENLEVSEMADVFNTIHC